MKNFSNTINSNNSINSFNPSNASKIIGFRKSFLDPSRIKKEIPKLFHRNKYSNSLKAQNIHFNLNKNNNQKILENYDLSNDIKFQNNNSTYKASISSNNTNTNYYSKRRSQLYKNIKTIESETTQSRNLNKYNGTSLSRTTWSSFSFTEGTNSINPLIKGHDNRINKNQYFKNDNNNELDVSQLNEHDLKKFEGNGIKYCIDKDGNPMKISDIRLKNKKPMAFIIQKQNQNILIDLDNKIIYPNINGDYILPQKPYFIIQKYDVLYPELRINNLEEKNSNNYISINVNDSNENINANKRSLIIKKDRAYKRKNNKSCNIYNFSNLEEKPNKFYVKIDKQYIQNRMSTFTPNNNQIKENYNNKIKNNLKEKKRKYIFVNKLAEANKSAQIKIKTDNNDNNFFKKFLQSNNSCKNQDLENKYLNRNEIKTEQKSFIENNKNKLFLKDLNNFKIRTNKLKDIKCFTHKEIKNLEFKFERKYKNIDNSLISNHPSFITTLKSKKVEETPKEKNSIKEETTESKTENILNKNNFENEVESAIKKKYTIESIKNLDLKKYKKKRCSYSLNQFMFNNIENQNNLKTPDNKINTLNTFNHSFISPTAETTSYNTIQNIHQDLDSNKKFVINSSNGLNIKKVNSFKYYLKPKINSQKVFHKRIKTEDMNSREKKFRFLKFINKKNNLNNNSIKQFYNTEIDFSIKNCQHNFNNSEEKKLFNNLRNNCNNVCQCPYCHHLFYN